MRAVLAKIFRLLRRPTPAVAVLGSRPGFLWEPHRNRWIPVEQALRTGFGAYSEIGPVYHSTGLQP